MDEEWTRLSLSAWSRIVLQPPPSSTCCCWCKMYFVFLSLYFFPNANYSNPKLLSLKLSYNPPKSSYANPSLLNQSRNRPKIHLIKLSNTYSLQPKEAWRRLSLSGKSSQLFNQVYSKANLQTKLSRKIKLGFFLTQPKPKLTK